MSCTARRVVTAAAASVIVAAVLAGHTVPARAGDPVSLRWTDRGGSTADGHVETDQDRQQLLSSVTINDGAAPTSGPRGSAASAPVCLWKPWAQVAASIDDQPGGGMNGGLDQTAAGGTKAVLYARVCGDGTVADWQWFAVPDRAASLAAARDEVRRRLPLPRPVLSPDPTVGLVVKVATWFAVPASQWVRVQATATALAATVTVTATPDTLVYDPGDGSAPVSCAGPGPAFDPTVPAPVAPPACSYTYRDASTAAPDRHAWPASLSVRWQVGWTASNGQTGALDPLVTTTPITVVVHEYQALEQGG
ncbi:hypothetical protein [Pseudofrankia sp. DC12]|uniref:hypothetical protein n=1 Tax=Pseudofrankia sp. DC12 TaxID=683315 RepID=UPI000696FBC2|nr:hypothetical protein [Pseudofrankia sp. DC12]